MVSNPNHYRGIEQIIGLQVRHNLTHLGIHVVDVVVVLGDGLTYARNIRVVVGNGNIRGVCDLTDQGRSGQRQPSNHGAERTSTLCLEGRQSTLMGGHKINHGEKGFVLRQLPPQGKVWRQSEITVIDIPYRKRLAKLVIRFGGIACGVSRLPQQFRKRFDVCWRHRFIVAIHGAHMLGT